MWTANTRSHSSRPVSGSYEVATGTISQVELASLEPPFSDLLSPGVSAPFSRRSTRPQHRGEPPVAGHDPDGIQAGDDSVRARDDPRRVADSVRGAQLAPQSRVSTVRLLRQEGARFTSRGKTAATGGKSQTFRVLASVSVKSARGAPFSVSHQLAR